MTAQNNVISFVTACVRFFGKLPGQTNLDVGKEVKALTPKDREEMIPGLEAALGVTIQK